jgi:hypothetical protein
LLGTHALGSLDWVPYDGDHSLFYMRAQNYREARVLPVQKTHILFCRLPAGVVTQLPTDHVFIKIEDHGLRTLSGFLGHAVDYTLPQIFSFLSYTLRRPITHEYPASSRRYKGFVHSEVVPRSLANAFIDFKLSAVASGVDLPHTELLTASGVGLRMMVPLVQSAQHLPEAIKFIELLERKNFDHLDRRSGAEVIFTKEELIRMSIDSSFEK